MRIENNNELKEKYKSKVELCLNRIICVYPELRKPIDIIYTEQNSMFYKLDESQLNGRAWYCDGYIYLTKDVLCQNQVLLTKVILHELLHHNYPTWKHEKIIEMTSSKLKQLCDRYIILKLQEDDL